MLFRLGELVAWTEAAGVFAERAAAVADGTAHEKSPKRFDATTLAAMSRVFAREAAARVALDGSRWVAGAADPGSPRSSPSPASPPPRSRQPRPG